MKVEENQLTEEEGDEFISSEKTFKDNYQSVLEYLIHINKQEPIKIDNRTANEDDLKKYLDYKFANKLPKTDNDLQNYKNVEVTVYKFMANDDNLSDGTRSWKSEEFESDFTDDEMENEIDHLINILDKLEAQNN